MSQRILGIDLHRWTVGDEAEIDVDNRGFREATSNVYDNG